MNCPKCNGELEIIQNAYALRDGSTFPGHVCRPCKTLWSEGCEGFAAFINHAKEIASNNTEVK